MARTKQTSRKSGKKSSDLSPDEIKKLKVTELKNYARDRGKLHSKGSGKGDGVTKGDLLFWLGAGPNPGNSPAPSTPAGRSKKSKTSTSKSSTSKKTSTSKKPKKSSVKVKTTKTLDRLVIKSGLEHFKEVLGQMDILHQLIFADNYDNLMDELHTHFGELEKLLGYTPPQPPKKETPSESASSSVDNAPVYAKKYARDPDLDFFEAGRKDKMMRKFKKTLDLKKSQVRFLERNTTSGWSMPSDMGKKLRKFLRKNNVDYRELSKKEVTALIKSHESSEEEEKKESVTDEVSAEDEVEDIEKEESAEEEVSAEDEVEDIEKEESSEEEVEKSSPAEEESSPPRPAKKIISYSSDHKAFLDGEGYIYDTESQSIFGRWDEQKNKARKLTSAEASSIEKAGNIRLWHIAVEKRKVKKVASSKEVKSLYEKNQRKKESEKVEEESAPEEESEEESAPEEEESEKKTKKEKTKDKNEDESKEEDDSSVFEGSDSSDDNAPEEGQTKELKKSGDGEDSSSDEADEADDAIRETVDDPEEITEKMFAKFEAVRTTGSIDMSDISSVAKESGLDEEVVDTIVTNYPRFKDRFQQITARAELKKAQARRAPPRAGRGRGKAAPKKDPKKDPKKKGKKLRRR